MEAVTPFLFPALLLAGFYLLVIRPARTRRTALTQMQERLAPGLEVMTTAGMFATVSTVEDEAVVLEVSPGVTVRFAKAAVARILSPDEPLDDAEPGEHPDPAADASIAEAPTDARPESDQPSR